MTIKEWAQRNTGLVLLIPKGTTIDHEHQYFEDGEWTNKPKDWRDKPRRYQAIVTKEDQYVEVTLDTKGLEAMALKATRNRSGQTRDGALSMKRRKR